MLDTAVRVERVRHTKAGWLLAFVAVAFAATLLLGSGAARALPACTDNYIGAADGSWTVASNWDNGLPGSTDVACIPGSDGTITLASGLATVADLESQSAVEIDGGTLQILDSTSPSSVAGLTISSGEYSAASGVELDDGGTFLWSGGDLGETSPGTPLPLLSVSSSFTSTVSASGTDSALDLSTASPLSVTGDPTVDLGSQWTATNAVNFADGAGLATDASTDGAALTLSGSLASLTRSSGSDPVDIAVGLANEGGTVVVSGDTMDLSGAVSNTGMVFVGAGGTLGSSGTFTQSSGTLNLLSSDAVFGTAGGQIEIDGGLLDGIGTLVGSVTNEATLSPGLTVGEAAVISVTGTYTQTSAGTFDVDVTGPGGAGNAGVTYDQLAVTGAASLAGTLFVSATTDPASGDPYSFLSYGSLMGSFDSEGGNTLNDGKVWQLVYGATSATLTANGGNEPPTAAFTDTPSGLGVSFDASGSFDPDGTIASYAWDFGDGTQGTGETPTHAYATAGTYSVQLTVTDNDGATDSVTHDVVVTTPPTVNEPPQANFQVTPSTDAGSLEVSVDASSSFDSDGSIVSYAWDFGDSTTGTGVTAQHTYLLPGTYTITLEVTDNDGATDTTTHDVIVPVLLGFGTTTALQVTSTPVLGQYGVVNGQTIDDYTYATTLVATVAPTPDGGDVQFTSGGSTIPGCGSVSVDSDTGTAQCSFTADPGSPVGYAATYSGTGAYATSSSATTTVDLPQWDELQLSQSTTPTVGTPDTYTASLLAPFGGSVGGDVAFTDANGNPYSGCASVPVTNDKATCAITFASSGTPEVDASYAGSTMWIGSSQELNPTVAATEVSTTVAAVYGDSNPGSATTFTAHVNPAPAGGTVAFVLTPPDSPPSYNGVPYTISGCGAVPVDASGNATCTYDWSTSDFGTFEIAMNYSGYSTATTKYDPASSSGNAVYLDTSYNVVGMALPAAQVNGASVTITASLTTVDPDAITGGPPGEVTFSEGGTALTACTSVWIDWTLQTQYGAQSGPAGATNYPALYNGAATCTATFSPGSHTISASYSGGVDGIVMVSRFDSVDVYYGAIPAPGTAPPVVTFTATTTSTPIAPPPPSAPTGLTFGSPTSKTVQGTTATTVNEHTSTASAQVTVPGGALPSGTTVSIYPVQTNKKVLGQVPVGQSYLAAFAVAWTTSSGTSPTAKKPLTMTITDPAIKAGDAIYVETSKGPKAVGTATTNGKATITFTTDPVLLVAAVPELTVHAAGSRVELSCSNTACSGVVELLAGRTVVAHARYRLKAGARTTVVLKPTKPATAAEVTVVGGKTRKLSLKG